MFKLMIKLVVLGLLIVAYHGVTDYQPQPRTSAGSFSGGPDSQSNSFSVGVDMS